MMPFMSYSLICGGSCRQSSGAFTKPPKAIVATQHVLPPLVVFQVPKHCLTDTAFEGFLRYPSQLTLNLGSVDGVPAIMARTVGNEGNQLFIRPKRRIPEDAIHQAVHRWFQLLPDCAFRYGHQCCRSLPTSPRDYFEQSPCMIVHK